MQLILIRHPQPEIAAGICYGASDIPLRAPAAEVAAQLAPRLLDLAGMPQRLFTSPLQRCAQLAHALSALQPNLPLQSDARLAELNFGKWELQPWNSVGASAMDAWIASDYADHHGGESLQAFDARIGAWLGSLSVSADDAAPLWVVAHAGVVRSLLRQWLGCSIAESLAWPIDYGRTLALRGQADAPATLLWSNL